MSHRGRCFAEEVGLELSCHLAERKEASRTGAGGKAKGVNKEILARGAKGIGLIMSD